RKLVSRGFSLGWYELSQVPKDATQVVNGVDLLFAATERQARNFDGKRLTSSMSDFALSKCRRSEWNEIQR
ncbi:MAG: hypothetical protein ACRED3_12110, partial [Bradyrhizobium sp.]